MSIPFSGNQKLFPKIFVSLSL